LPEQRKTREKQFYNVMGRICTSADWMIKNCYLPKLNNGDVLATMDAGAYFSSYSSNFAFTRPAIVMVDTSGKTRIIRNRETFEHLVAMDELGGQG
jgi:diaminopimelate decarboxylase